MPNFEFLYLKKSYLLFFSILIFAIGVLIGKSIFSKSETKVTHDNQNEIVKPNETNQEDKNHSKDKPSDLIKDDEQNFPKYVLETLAYIDENNAAPDGFVGGRLFKNREQLLPKIDDKKKKITYQEWDVHAKSNGSNRGAERIVTGDDGSAYFTNDHYSSFKKIR